MSRSLLGLSVVSTTLILLSACQTPTKTTPATTPQPTSAPAATRADHKPEGFQVFMASNTPREGYREAALPPERRPVSGNAPTTAPTAAGERIYLAPQPALDAQDVDTATAQPDVGGRGAVTIKLTERGKQRMDELTRNSIGGRLAIVVNGKPLIAPVITSRVPGGIVQISGDFTLEEAERIADTIRTAR